LFVIVILPPLMAIPYLNIFKLFPVIVIFEYLVGFIVPIDFLLILIKASAPLKADDCIVKFDIVTLSEAILIKSPILFLDKIAFELSFCDVKVISLSITIVSK